VFEDVAHTSFVVGTITLAPVSPGNPNLKQVAGSAAVGLIDPNLLTFARGSAADIPVTPAFIAHTLAAGTDVTLQASNDLTIDTPLRVTPTGAKGGNLTLKAGRSIVVTADVATAGGALTLI